MSTPVPPASSAESDGVTPPAGESLASVIRGGAARLARAGVPDPEVDVLLLLGHLLARGRGQVQAAAVRGDVLDAELRPAFDELIERRSAREPLQHLTGEAAFRHLVLRVGPGVFVPRPETEAVAQLAIDALTATAAEAPIAVDLGTGSGALALALATEVPHARVYAVERAVDAFVWAKENARRLGADNATVVHGEWESALPDLGGTVSVVVSNPPYVPDDAIPRDPEVHRFDPPEALYGGADGLDPIRSVSATAMRLLHPGGTVVVEHGEAQGGGVRGIFESHGWRAVGTHPDLTLRDRATTALRP